MSKPSVRRYWVTIRDPYSGLEYKLLVVVSGGQVVIESEEADILKIEEAT